tara:strand:- start:926 stop:1531 length:606 start_codon:yes stop_codon:yes gene_type:complete
MRTVLEILTKSNLTREDFINKIGKFMEKEFNDTLLDAQQIDTRNNYNISPVEKFRYRITHYRENAYTEDVYDLFELCIEMPLDTFSDYMECQGSLYDNDSRRIKSRCTATVPVTDFTMVRYPYPTDTDKRVPICKACLKEGSYLQCEHCYEYVHLGDGLHGRWSGDYDQRVGFNESNADICRSCMEQDDLYSNEGWRFWYN